MTINQSVLCSPSGVVGVLLDSLHEDGDGLRLDKRCVAFASLVIDTLYESLCFVITSHNLVQLL